jgi:hypothetical protein
MTAKQKDETYNAILAEITKEVDDAEKAYLDSIKEEEVE